MPKQLYGHKHAKARGVPAEPAAVGVWLTLMAGLPEELQHRAIIAAATEAGLELAADSRDSFAAALVEYGSERRADCDEAWIGVLLELCSDFGVPLGDVADADVADAGADAAERAGATELLGALRRHRVVCNEPPPPPPLREGVAVLAVLEEDEEWHEARVVKLIPPPSGRGAPLVLVRFVEWQKVQETSRAKVVPLAEVADDEDAAEAEGECELCRRSLALTFHHLVPVATHGRYLGKCLPHGVAEAASDRGPAPQPSREFLHSYGAMLCRFCHSTVHRFAPNAVLAERFNTLDKLREQPPLARFVEFASRQRQSACLCR